MTAQTILPANSVSDTAFNSNSCRFDGTGAYMSKTPGSDGDAQKMTTSIWFKRGVLGRDIRWFEMGDLMLYSGTNIIGFANRAFDFDVYTESNFLMDTAAWYHIVWSVDTTQSTAANRVKIYVNGVLLTSANGLHADISYMDQNANLECNQQEVHRVGAVSTTAASFFDGYMAEFVHIDGTQLAADQFGEFDEDSNIWKPIDVSGLTFGTNGFYLDFKASGNLGNDANGGTDLTEVNLAATDQSTDTCTNNFTLWNALNQQSSISYSEGNTTFINSSGGNRMAFSNFGVTAGKWYAELKVGVVHNHMRLGVADISFYIPVTNAYSTNLPNSISYANDNPIYIGGSSQGDFGSFTTDDIISIVMDMDNGFVYFAKNGTYLNSGDPTSGSDGTGGFAIPNYTTKTYCFLGSSYDGGTDATVLANFGSPSYSESGGETDGNGYGNFAHAVPSGYFSLNTKNLAENG